MTYEEAMSHHGRGEGAGMTTTELNEALAGKAGWWRTGFTPKWDAASNELVPQWYSPKGNACIDLPFDFAHSIDAQVEWLDPLLEKHWDLVNEFILPAIGEVEVRLEPCGHPTIDFAGYGPTRAEARARAILEALR